MRRCWEIQSNGSSVPKAAINHDQPVLCSDWSSDGSTVFSGGPPAARMQAMHLAPMHHGTRECLGCTCPGPCPAAREYSFTELAHGVRKRSLPGAGGCDSTVKMWNLATQQQQQVAKHDGPVRHCKLVCLSFSRTWYAVPQSTHRAGSVPVQVLLQNGPANGVSSVVRPC